MGCKSRSKPPEGREFFQAGFPCLVIYFMLDVLSLASVSTPLHLFGAISCTKVLFRDCRLYHLSQTLQICEYKSYWISQIMVLRFQAHYQQGLEPK